jgi:hypothetical protein
MNDTIPTWKIRPHKKGDTFNSRKINFPFDITDCRIDMHFRKQANGLIVFSWSTENDTFEKISATEVTMKSRILDNATGVYISDLQVVFPDTTVFTYFNARIEINQDVTVITT